MPGEAAFSDFQRHYYLCLVFLLSETQEAKLLSGIVDFPASRGGSRKFRQGWPGHLSALWIPFIFLIFYKNEIKFQRKRGDSGLPPPQPENLPLTQLGDIK